MHPLVQRQWKRFLRKGPWFWLGTLALWGGLSFLARFGIFLLADVGFFANFTVWIFMLWSLVFFTLRADLFVALLLFFALSPQSEWKEAREQLGTLPLSPLRIVLSRGWVPLTILIVLNIIFAPFFYYHMYESGTMGMLSKSVALAYACMVGSAALVEDLLFCVIVFLFLMGRLAPDSARPEKVVVRLFVLIILISAMWAVTTGLRLLVDELIFRTGGAFVRLVVSDLINTLAVCGIELLVIWYLWSGVKRAAAEWADGE